VDLISDTTNASFFTSGACATPQPSDRYTLTAGSTTAFVTDNTAETVMLTATRFGGSESGSTPAITINPGAPQDLQKLCNLGATQCIGDSTDVYVAGDVVSLRVLVTDVFDSPVPGVAVSASVTAGGGGISGSPGVTDAGGYVQFTHTTGAVAGVNTVDVNCGTCSGVNTLSFSITTKTGTGVSDLDPSLAGVQGLAGADKSFYKAAGDDLVLMPIYSNTGDRVAFISKPTGACTAGLDCRWNIFVMPSGGGVATRLTNDNHYVTPGSTITFNYASGGLATDEWVAYGAHRMTLPQKTEWTGAGPWEVVYLSGISSENAKPYAVINLSSGANGTELSAIADDSVPGPGQWSWVTAGNQVRVGTNPTGAEEIAIVGKLPDLHRVRTNGAGANVPGIINANSPVLMVKASEGNAGPMDPHWTNCGLLASREGNLLKIENPTLRQPQDLVFSSLFDPLRVTRGQTR
jgi:hypothetical protein